MITRIKRIFRFRLALPTVLLLGGLFLFFACTFDWFGIETTKPILFEIFEKAGNLILISSVIAFLIDSAEYMGAFKRELEEVIYDTKFLKKRNDIEGVWRGVSEVLFESKFPKISSDLMDAVKGYFVPDEDLKLNYYNDYRITYTVTYDKDDSDFIHVESKTSFQLNVEDGKEFEFPMRHWTCVDESSQDTVETAMGSIIVNGDERTDLGEPVKTYHNDTVCYCFKLKLKGCTEYQIDQTVNKKYNLKKDNFLAFRARWLVNDMRVQLFHPADMQVLFVNRATAKDFKKNHDTKVFKEYEYKGLILKRQGYIIILNKQQNLIK
ncbi:MAG: hypothetical protein IKT03_05135 [Muribaculaceae bacterium]|nr:hypothetical protein [Muribaculaceae bacterium]